jgi:F-type H+-transporting ATPase subunit b
VSFDWTTFTLEVLNVLVLVWLLKRFLYRPVLAVIEKRRAEGEKVMVAAEALRDEARALKVEYEARLARAAEDRDRAMARLEVDVAAERARRLAAVEAEVNADRQRRQMLEARERDERDARQERQAAAVAAHFATRLLDRVASPELEDKLVDLTVADLQALEPEQRAAVQAALDSPAVELRVVTAHRLAPARRAALIAALESLTGSAPAPEFQEDPTLKAGVRIEAGSWVLMANLRDELEFFSASGDHDG